MAYSDVLRTDYQDAVWSGNRKYRLTTNGDNTTSVTDVTEYSVEGDNFGSGDINRTNAVIKEVENAQLSSRKITLPASGWSASTVAIDGMALYVQTVTVTAIYNEHPVISIDAAGTLPTEEEENAYALIKAAVASVDTNRITFYATERPTSTVYVLAKEVS